MHPAFSVIFFTVFSGAGYGLWMWLGLMTVAGTAPTRAVAITALLLGSACVGAGLLSSLLHLGKPLRAWRAFSQWRSSWLSREGIAAVLGFLPAAWLGWALWTAGEARPAAALLVVLSLATVICTAMIYASLKPIPAWRHPLVVPIYILLSLLTGGLLLLMLLALHGAPLAPWSLFAVLVGCVTFWRLKSHTWRWIDRGALPVTRNSALGLPADRQVTVFERPHTEANYLLKEMGFVLARRHATKLRRLAVALGAALPALCVLVPWLLPSAQPAPWLLLAAVAMMAGALVERWLFFAQARHLVTLYY